MLPPCCCSGVVFLIIERDIKRFMVYSYRRCSGPRNVEIDMAITARLVTGCDSHMLGETKVEVAGGVPPARWPRAHLQAGMGCWAAFLRRGRGGTQGTRNWAVSFADITNIKREKSNFRSALRANFILFSCSCHLLFGFLIQAGSATGGG